MRLKLLISTAVAAGALTAGVAMAQTAEPSQSTIPPTNDPTTFTDDQCGKHQGPRPCGAQVQSVPMEPSPASQTDLDSMAPAPAPMADTSTTTLYQAPAMSPEVNTTLVTNGPVPDTPENRARFGGPNSNGGRQTAPRGN